MLCECLLYTHRSVRFPVLSPVLSPLLHIFLKLQNFPEPTFNDYEQPKLKLQARIQNWNTLLISLGKFAGTTATDALALSL